ncbi:MAG: VWA domain-containing protein, partial [Planctomycetes bacterium]|nr:VWA domain-containing protein [Planctomycetota bacterium]
RDVEPTRLDEAKRQVAELIGQMESGDEAMIISFSNAAATVQSYTGNQPLLLRRLETIRPTQRTTDLDEALRMAASLANPGQSGTESHDRAVADALPARLFIFSDGKFRDVSEFQLGNLFPSEDRKPVFVPIGDSQTPNVAITALGTQRSEDNPDQMDVFARVDNCGSEAVEIFAELFTDDEAKILKDRVSVMVEPGKTKGIEFRRLLGMDSGVLTLKITPDDLFSVDNTAWAVVDSPRRAKVLVATRGNQPLRVALSTLRVEQLAEVTFIDPEALGEYQQQMQNGQYDLVVYDDCLPPIAQVAALENGNGSGADALPPLMPQANTLMIGHIPPGGAWSAKAKVAGPQIIDVEQAHPLMKFIDMGDVLLAEGMPLIAPPGGVTLISSTGVGTSDEAMAAIAPRGGFEDVVLGFTFQEEKDGETLLNTNWFRRRSFSVFILNLIEYLGVAGGGLAGYGQQGATYRPGETVRLVGGETVQILRVVTPGGPSQSIERGGLGTFTFSKSDEVGVYEVFAGERLVQRFAVNLFSSRESDVGARVDDPIKIGNIEIESDESWHAGRKELWKLLIFVALGISLLEWYVYNRRIYV